MVPVQTTSPRSMIVCRSASSHKASSSLSITRIDKPVRLRSASRLQISVRGLPAAKGGVYTVWLYSSVIDARNIGSARGPDISLDARLPEKIAKYRYVDVSFEPADSNANHSGRSVLRVPTAKLLKK